jgi:hypothetical protein
MGRLPGPNPYGDKMPSTDIDGSPILILNRKQIKLIKDMSSPITLEEDQLIKKIDKFLEDTK